MGLKHRYRIKGIQLEKLHLKKSMYQALWVSSICLLAGCSSLITVIAADKKTGDSGLPPTEKINTVPEQKVLEPPVSASPSPSPTRPNPNNRKPILQQISVNPTQTILKDDIITLKVLSFDADGDPLRLTWQATKGLLSSNQGEAVTWKPQKSDGSFESGIATITVIVDDNRGGIDSTSVNIQIDDKGAAKLNPETVISPVQTSVKAIETSSPEVLLELGQVKQLSVSVIHADNTQTQEIIWLSSDPKIVSVSQTGQVTRHQAGDVVIYAKALLDPTKQQVIRVTEGTATLIPQPKPSQSSPIPSENLVPLPPSDLSSSPTVPVQSGSLMVSTLAGNGSQGYLDGMGTSAQFNSPLGICVDVNGNVYVTDGMQPRIRKITSGGEVTTFAGSGSQGYSDGLGTAAQFKFLSSIGIAIDINGYIYVADSYNHRIRKITPSGMVTTLAGSGVDGYADGNGVLAQFNYPSGIAVDLQGHVYVADSNNLRIRKITPSGVVTTLAGSGTKSFSDGMGTAAHFSTPKGIAVDQSGNAYVADTANHRIRKISSSGMVTTLAGSGASGYVDGIGTSAQFYGPYGISVDNSGNLYVADTTNRRIRKITASGLVSTLAGTGVFGYVDGEGSSAQFRMPFGVAVDTQGNVFVTEEHQVRKISSFR